MISTPWVTERPRGVGVIRCGNDSVAPGNPIRKFIATPGWMSVKVILCGGVPWLTTRPTVPTRTGTGNVAAFRSGSSTAQSSGVVQRFHTASADAVVRWV